MAQSIKNAVYVPFSKDGVFWYNCCISGTVMKKYLASLILLILGISQINAENDSASVVRAWQLEDDFSRSVPVNIDTNLTNFQIYYPNYMISESNSFLGNIGTPTVSNIFSDRIFDHDAFFLNQYLPYFHTAENTEYYNTKKPFSRLTYTHGGSGDNREETFEAFITENLSPKLNFALRYHNISSKGQYLYQQVKKNAFRLSVNYTGQRYVAHGSFNINRHKANESGGVIDSVFRSGNYENIKEIPTRIDGGLSPAYDSDVQNRIRYYDFMVNQRLRLFTLSTKIDSTRPARGRTMAEPVLSYTIRASRATKTYTDQDPLGSGIYDQVHFNSLKTLDSVANFRLTNLLKLEFKTTLRGKVLVGIHGSLGNDFEKYYFYSEWDTTYTPGDTLLTPHILTGGDTLKGIDQSENISSTYFSAGLYGSFWNRVRSSFRGKVYFLGYKSGQTELNGSLNTNLSILKKEFIFDASVDFKNLMPGYLLQNYYSNNFIWLEQQQNLSSVIWTSLSGKISAPSNNFELTGKYYLISNLIYFNQDAVPANYGNPVNVISVDAAKTFKLWKLYSVNKITYQVSENPEVLAIPNLVVYNSTYFNHTFHFLSTGGELQTMFGVEVFYTTDFYGYEYSPALSQFYIQDEELIGNSLLMDVFINMKLKRTRFFVKLQHFNSEWFGQNYYASVRYPHDQLMDYNTLIVKFGLSWAFYD
jgi:hypothetical protein